MANDRLIIVCKHCKWGRNLAKYYPGGTGDPNGSDIEGWIDYHWFHCHQPGFDLNGDLGFRLVAENGTPMRLAENRKGWLIQDEVSGD